MMLRCGSLPTYACIAPRSRQAVRVQYVLFASASTSAPRLPPEFCACSVAATALAKDSSKSAGSDSRSLVTTMTGTITSHSSHLADSAARPDRSRAYSLPETAAQREFGREEHDPAFSPWSDRLRSVSLDRR